VLIYSDHQNLEYFTTTKILNRRQARWAEELAGIDLEICYRPGTLNGKPDALSWWSDYLPSKGGSEDQPIKSVLSEKNFQDEIYIKDQGKHIIAAMTVVKKRGRQWDTECLRRVRDEGLKDQDYVKAMDSLRGGNKHADEILHEEHGILFRWLRLWIPSSLRDDVLVSEYNPKVTGHMGQDKTKELIKDISGGQEWMKILSSISRPVSNARGINQRGINYMASYNLSNWHMLRGSQSRWILSQTFH
jgi:hypothetical protein